MLLDVIVKRWAEAARRFDPPYARNRAGAVDERQVYPIGRELSFRKSILYPAESETVCFPVFWAAARPFAPWRIGSARVFGRRARGALRSVSPIIPVQDVATLP